MCVNRCVGVFCIFLHVLHIRTHRFETAAFVSAAAHMDQFLDVFHALYQPVLEVSRTDACLRSTVGRNMITQEYAACAVCANQPRTVRQK